MSIALSPSSPSLESSYVSYPNSSTASSRPTFAQTSIQHSTRESGTSPTQHHSAAFSNSTPSVSTTPAREDHDRMERSESSFSQSGGQESEVHSSQQSHGQNHDRIDRDMEDQGRIGISNTSGSQTYLPVGTTESDIFEEGDQMDTAPDDFSLNGSHTAPPQGMLQVNSVGALLVRLLTLLSSCFASLRHRP